MEEITNKLKELDEKLELLIEKEEKEMLELGIVKQLIKSIMEEAEK